MRYLLAVVFAVLLVGATVVGIVTTAHDYGQRPTVGSSQDGLVLYGGR